MPKWVDRESGSVAPGGKSPAERARSELRLLIINARRDPSLAQHLRRLLGSVQDKGDAIADDDVRTILDEANAIISGHALLRAAQQSDANGIEQLLGEGAPVNFQDPRTGATALHYAAAYRARPAFRALLKSVQCDFLLRDRKGRLAWELASSADDSAMTRLLISKTARQARERGVPFPRRRPPRVSV